MPSLDRFARQLALAALPLSRVFPAKREPAHDSLANAIDFSLLFFLRRGKNINYTKIFETQFQISVIEKL